jgi:hypothetical protein
MFESGARRWRRTSRGALIGAAIVVASVVIPTVAFATLGGGATVNLCVNTHHTVRVVGGSASCRSDEQTVQIYTKAGADQRFALQPHSHTVNLFEQESSCTTGTTGSGNAEVVFFSCALYDNPNITGSSVGSEDGSYVGPVGGPNEAALTFHLAHGDIQAAGIYSGSATTSHFSIIGGTGLYVGATGTVGGVFYNSDADFHWIVNYHR